MRAKEFVINVPITIKINGDGDPKIDMPNDDSDDISKLNDNPVMVPPLQQDIELKKAAAGKNSPIIQKLTQDEIDPEEKAKGLLHPLLVKN